ncbi:hypothetical protein FNN84_22790 [Salmonella enterica subsp. salamae]|uniref:Uncharacterized protein n=1 Tax=Salmonella enterica subsp. salamae TaxID=59202 RepID=A0A5Y2S747_SALER|nr:hypothetical protein [Salmonella enterica subsp. salamae]ECJ2314566.1 hypothetical protein [Salmonella enterica subsp. salamae]
MTSRPFIFCQKPRFSAGSGVLIRQHYTGTEVLAPPGAHYLLQTRTAVLNNELQDKFVCWYPGFQNNGKVAATTAAAQLTLPQGFHSSASRQKGYLVTEP